VKKLVKFFFGFLFGLVLLYVLEGACFRLVEQYAEFRLKVSWGNPGSAEYHPFLKWTHLDHFTEPPVESLDLNQSPYDTAMTEGDYADTVMSFARPMRDRYEEHVRSKHDPLAKFEIRDYGKIRGLVLPGLKKTAELEHVNQKYARRVGDDLEYSEGMLVRIISSPEPEDYEAEFAELESSFGFLLENGIACLVLPASSGEDVLKKITYLQKNHRLLTENIFAWGDQHAAGYLLEACRKAPEKFKAIVMADPIGVPSPPRMIGLPWLTVQISDETRTSEADLSKILQWVRLGRKGGSFYPSRLGGLLHTEDSPVTGQMPSFLVSCLLQCSRYIERAGNQWPVPIPDNDGGKEKQPPPINSPTKAEGNKPFDLDRIEKTILELSKEEEETVNLVDATFDCEMVRGYRELHSDNANLRQVSNRDLVLMLGVEFEKKGEGVLDQVRERDPLFYRFYLSLRALEESPIH
jgi:hypothetical protein